MHAMSANKREMGAEPSGMPKEFWEDYKGWLDEGLCDEPLAEKVVAWLSERGLCDDDFYDHVRTGNEPSGPDWRSLAEHLCALHMGRMHLGKCLSESATPLLYTVAKPLLGLGTHLLYVNPGGTERHFFAFALNGPYRGRIFAPQGWCVDRNPGYIALKARGFVQPTILKKLEEHIRNVAPLRPRPAPSCTVQVLDAVAVVPEAETDAAAEVKPGAAVEVAVAAPAGKRAREKARAEEPPTKLVKITVRPPRPGFFTSYEPTACNRDHEAWGGCNQCDLTAGHDGPHMWRQARTRGSGAAEWQYKLREDNCAFSPGQKEVADVNDLARFGEGALPLAAERQAAREAARATARAVVEQVAEPATAAGSSSSLAILTNAAAEAAEAAVQSTVHPQSPVWSDVGGAAPERWSPDPKPDAGKGTDGVPPMPPDAVVYEEPVTPVPSPPGSEVERLARELANKKSALANLKLEQMMVEGEIQKLKDAIVASMG